MLNSKIVINHGGLIFPGILGDYDLGFSVILIIIISCIIIKFLNKSLKLNPILSYIIYFYHLAWTLLFIYFSITLSSDASTYYQQGIYLITFGDPSLNNWKDINIFSMTVINHYLMNFFSLNYYSLTLVYSLLGAIGLILFNQVLQDIVKNKSNFVKIVSQLIIFFPSFSFWSSGIGKDAIAFFTILFFLNFLYFKRYNLTLLAIFFSLLLLITRTHIGVTLIFAITIHMAFNLNLSKKVIFLIFLLCIPIGLKSLMIIVGISLNDIINLTLISKFFIIAETQRNYFLSTPAGFDTQNLNIFYLMLNYLFNPLTNFSGLKNILTSFENIGHIIFTGVLIIFGIRNFNIFNKKNIFAASFFIAALFFLSLFSANYGIFWRQKTMIMPLLYYLIIVSTKFIPNKSKLE